MCDQRLSQAYAALQPHRTGLTKNLTPEGDSGMCVLVFWSTEILPSLRDPLSDPSRALRSFLDLLTTHRLEAFDRSFELGPCPVPPASLEYNVLITPERLHLRGSLCTNKISNEKRNKVRVGLCLGFPYLIYVFGLPKYWQDSSLDGRN